MTIYYIIKKKHPLGAEINQNVLIYCTTNLYKTLKTILYRLEVQLICFDLLCIDLFSINVNFKTSFQLKTFIFFKYQLMGPVYQT